MRDGDKCVCGVFCSLERSGTASPPAASTWLLIASTNNKESDARACICGVCNYSFAASVHSAARPCTSMHFCVCLYMQMCIK